MVWREILKLNFKKSCRPDEMHPQILIELEDHSRHKTGKALPNN